MCSRVLHNESSSWPHSLKLHMWVKPWRTVISFPYSEWMALPELSLSSTLACLSTLSLQPWVGVNKHARGDDTVVAYPFSWHDKLLVTQCFPMAPTVAFNSCCSPHINIEVRLARTPFVEPWLDSRSFGSFCTRTQTGETWLDHTTYFLPGNPPQNRLSPDTANMQQKGEAGCAKPAHRSAHRTANPAYTGGKHKKMIYSKEKRDICSALCSLVHISGFHLSETVFSLQSLLLGPKGFALVVWKLFLSDKKQTRNNFISTSWE